MPITSIPGAPATTPIEIELFVEIDYYDGSFSYRYSENDFILIKGQKILIRLVKERTPPGSIIYFTGFSSTSPTDLPLVEPVDTSTGRPYEADKPFPLGTNHILLELNSDYRELVKFGTHVACKFTDSNGTLVSYEKLCDPQVGNGPPYP